MTAHPNAHILAQLAEIAKTDPEPWKRLQMKGVADDWIDCNFYANILHPEAVFRIKPITVNIGGVELEGPIREVPANVSTVWLLFDRAGISSLPYRFVMEIPEHKQWLNEGRLFASKEARDKYQDALVKLANGETN